MHERWRGKTRQVSLRQLASLPASPLNDEYVLEYNLLKLEMYKRGQTAQTAKITAIFRHEVIPAALSSGLTSLATALRLSMAGYLWSTGSEEDAQGLKSEPMKGIWYHSCLGSEWSKPAANLK